MVPTEDWEQKQVVKHCLEQGYKFTAIPNSTFTKSWKVKNRNTALGLRAGLCDLFIIANRHAMFVEMKRTKLSVTSADQKAWVAAIKDAGIPVIIALGHKAAIEFIESVANPAVPDEYWAGRARA